MCNASIFMWAVGESPSHRISWPPLRSCIMIQISQGSLPDPLRDRLRDNYTHLTNVWLQMMQPHASSPRLNTNCYYILRKRVPLGSTTRNIRVLVRAERRKRRNSFCLTTSLRRAQNTIVRKTPLFSLLLLLTLQPWFNNDVRMALGWSVLPQRGLFMGLNKVAFQRTVCVRVYVYMCMCVCEPYKLNWLPVLRWSYTSEAPCTVPAQVPLYGQVLEPERRPSSLWRPIE